MTDKILSYLKRMRSLLPQKLNRYHYLAFFAFVLVIGFFGFIQPVGASDGIMGNIADGFLHFFTWLMLIVADLCIGLTIFFLRFFISIAAYNNYIDVDVVQLGWIMIRDVANMFFVVALLVIAFGTILGIEEYEWKKNLVKLILAAILINFSNLIAQLIIDIAHVFTITFLNAIAATAGGNLINMFKLDQITQMVGAAGDSGDFRMEMAAGAIAATGFAVLAAVAMGSYAYVMMVRVVVLWGLIILAPGAYILGVLPKTKAYADRWWSEFGKHVVVAPVMVFFLWLSFATLGNGQIAQDIQAGQNNKQFQLTQDTQTSYESQGLKKYDNPTLSLSKVTTWENMASFFIAMAFMYYGLKVTQETGATGAGAVGSALEFGKKVATIATGYAAGRWLAGGAVNLAKGAGKGVLKGVGWVAYHAPIADISGRVERGKDFFKRQWQSFEGWRNAPEGPTRKVEWIVDEKTGEGRYQAVKKMVKNEKGEMVDSGEYELEDVELGIFQKWAHHTVIKNAESKKKLEKTEKFAETRKEMLDKSTRGVPTGWFMKPYEQTDASDRFERGRLKAMQERSAAKTEEFEGLGAMAERSQARYQNIVHKGWLYDSIEKRGKKETLSDELAGHKVRAEAVKKRTEEMAERSKKTVSAGTGKSAVQARMKAELSIKALQGETKAIEGQVMFGMAKQDIEVAKETRSRIDRMIETIKEKNPTMTTKDVVRSLVDEKRITAAQAEQYTEGEGKGLVYRAAAAEKQAHTEATKLEELVGAKTREYSESDHGLAEIAEDAELAKEIETNKGAITVLEDFAKRTLNKEGEEAAKEVAKKVKEILDGALTEDQKKATSKLSVADEMARRMENQRNKIGKDVGDEIRKKHEDTTKKKKALFDQADARRQALEADEGYKNFKKDPENIKKMKSFEDLSKQFDIETDESKKADIANKIKSLSGELEYSFSHNGDEMSSADIYQDVERAKADITEHDVVVGKEVVAAQEPIIKKFDELVENKKIAANLDEAQKKMKLADESAQEDPLYKKAVHEARKVEKERFAGHDAAAIALRSAKQKQASANAKAASEESEKSLQHQSLSLESVHNLFTSEDAFKTGAELADAFIKTIKSEHLNEMFEKAGESIKKAAETIGEKAKETALNRLAAKNVYVRSLKAQKEEHHRQEAMTISKTAAEALAEAEYVERGVMGLALPSSSLVPIAKRLADGLNSLTSEALGKALTDNLAFLAVKTKGGKGGPVKDVMQRAAAFGVVNKVNTEAYIDDAIGEIAKQINRLEKGELEGEEKEKIKQLQEVWEHGLHVITRGADGKAMGLSNAKNASLVQNYAISGGDLEQVKQHMEISKIADARPDHDYKQATEDYFKSIGDTTGKAAETYLKKMKENDTFLKEAASAFKSQALAAGHSENGAHQKFDSSLGFHRMSTEGEAVNIMEAEMRKRGSKVNYQYHSLGDVNTTTGVMTRVDRDQYARILGSAKKYLDIKQIQDRTRDGALGYAPSSTKAKDKENRGLLGGTVDTIKKSFGSLKQFIEGVVIPEVAGGSESLALIAQLGFGNVTSQEAENGIAKIAIDLGEGKSIKGDTMAEFISNLQNYIKDKSNNIEIDDDTEKLIETARKNMKELAEAAKFKVNNPSDGSADDVAVDDGVAGGG